MTSKTSIINRALFELGKARITNPAQMTEAARTLDETFDAVRDIVLRAHPWNSARARALLSERSDTPAFEYAKWYNLPTDPYCLRVIGIHDYDGDWVVEGRQLLTDRGGPLPVKFIKRVTNVGEFDPLLAEAVGLRLALNNWSKLAEDGRSKDRTIELYQGAVAEARSVDGQEGTPEEFWPDDFVESRLA